MSFLECERSAPLGVLLKGRIVVIVSVASIRSPAIVQERACSRATIVRSMLVRFPSSITGLEANLVLVRLLY